MSPAAVAAAVRAESGGIASDLDVLAALRLLRQEFVGAGPLDELLRDPRTTDVLVSGPTSVWVDRGAGLERTALRFPDEPAVRRLAQRLAVAAGRRLDDASPYVDGWLADAGVRLHAVLPPVAADGTCLSLRVLRPTTHDLGTLRDLGTVDDAGEGLLRAMLAARLAFLVSGGTGSGKTTLLAALLSAVDPAERLVVVEDAEELRPRHPHVVRLIARPANIEGAGGVGLRDLVRQALRMRPDRLVVGEVRGAEVCDLLAALNTGHEGGAGTVHANSVRELPARMEALAATGGLPRAALHSQLAAAVQVVVHMRRDAARPPGVRGGRGTDPRRQRRGAGAAGLDPAGRLDRRSRRPRRAARGPRGAGAMVTASGVTASEVASGVTAPVVVAACLAGAVAHGPGVRDARRRDRVSAGIGGPCPPAGADLAAGSPTAVATSGGARTDRRGRRVAAAGPGWGGGRGPRAWGRFGAAGSGGGPRPWPAPPPTSSPTRCAG